MSNNTWGSMGGRNVAGTSESWLCRCGARNIGTRFCQNCSLAIDDSGRIVEGGSIEVKQQNGYAPMVIAAVIGSVIIGVGAFLLIGREAPERGPLTTLTSSTTTAPGSAPPTTTTTLAP